VDAEPITFLGRPVGAAFRARVVTIAPGVRLPYVEADWVDALVVVESGEVEMEGREGARRRFATGDVLWLSGLGVLALCNRGDESAVLVAVSRRNRPTHEEPAEPD
jgi:quercetin dioxygenase-like cupin family protein